MGGNHGINDPYIVVHHGGTEKEDAVVVRELSLVDIGAVVLNVSAIVNVVIRVTDESNTLHPIPSLLSPVGVGCVSSITG